MEGAGGGGKRAGAEGGEKKGTPRGAGRGRGRGGRGGRVGGGSNRNANKTAGLLAQLTIDVLGDGSAAIKIRALDVVPKKGEGERKGKDSPDKEEKVSYPEQEKLILALVTWCACEDTVLNGVTLLTRPGVLQAKNSQGKLVEQYKSLQKEALQVCLLLVGCWLLLLPTLRSHFVYPGPGVPKLQGSDAEADGHHDKVLQQCLEQSRHQRPGKPVHMSFSRITSLHSLRLAGDHGSRGSRGRRDQ